MEPLLAEPRNQEDAAQLREKLHLFQLDQKHSIERLEALKAANQQKIKDLKNENRDMRVALTDAKRRSGIESSAHIVPSVGTQDQRGAVMFADQTRLKEQIRRERKQLDGILSRTRAQKTIYGALKDKMKDLNLEAQEPAKDAETYARKLQRSLLKYNEAQNIQLTYKQIVKRLKDDQMIIHADTISLQDSVSSKQHDYEELTQLLAESCASRDAITAEVCKAKATYDTEKQKRDTELREMQQHVKVYTDFLATKQRENDELTKKVEVYSFEKEQLNALVLARDVVDQQNLRKLESLNERLLRIEKQTGYRDARTVIEKFEHQKQTIKQLTRMEREKNDLFDKLQQQQQSLASRVGAIISSLYPTVPRIALHKMDSSDQYMELPLERAKYRLQRLTALLSDIRDGVEHILTRTLAVGVTTTISTHDIVKALDTIDSLLYGLSDPTRSAVVSSDKDAIKPGTPYSLYDLQSNMPRVDERHRDTNSRTRDALHISTKECSVESKMDQEKALHLGEDLDAESSRRRVKHASKRILVQSQGKNENHSVSKK